MINFAFLVKSYIKIKNSLYYIVKFILVIFIDNKLIQYFV